MYCATRDPVVDIGGASRRRRAPRSHHRHALLASADVLLRVRKAPIEEVEWLKSGSIPISFLDPFNERKLLGRLAEREDKSSLIYGMPIIDADRARTVLGLKRSMAPGFAGIGNSLFSRPNTLLLLGDAKASLQALIAAFKSTQQRAMSGGEKASNQDRQVRKPHAKGAKDAKKEGSF